ncbi:MAG: hypothetical protein RR620_13510, partial [Clostridium sp.]
EGQKELQEGQKELQEGQKELQEGQKRLEAKVEAIAEQTADLLEFREKVTADIDEIKLEIKMLRSDMSTVEMVTAHNYSDIARLKAVK